MPLGFFQKSNLITLFISCVIVSGCDHITPGMRMNTSGFTHVPVAEVRVAPVLIPITAATVHNQPNFYTGYRYYIGPQDIINIQVWNHPEFNVPSVVEQGSKEGNLQQNLILQQSVSTGAYGYGYLVGPNGRLFFPMIGQVPVSGLTVEQARIRLTQKLSHYVRDPQVQIRVTSFRSQKIYVMGEVEKPGVQVITDVPLSITEAVALAGGVDRQTSDPRHIYVVRGPLDNPRVYWLNAKSPDALLLGANFILQAHDIVYVSTANVVSWNRVISQILPTIETIWYTNSLMTHH